MWDQGCCGQISLKPSPYVKCTEADLFERCPTDGTLKTACMAVLDQILCRVLLYSSLAFNSTNDITFEYTTPGFTATDGLLTCLSSSWSIHPSSFSLVSLWEGGSQFDTTEKQIDTQNQQTAAFFSSASAKWNLSPIQYGSLYDILKGDAYFSSSSRRQR